MYVYLARDQDEKEREALLKALSNQSSPISFGLSFVSHAFVTLLKTHAHIPSSRLQYCSRKGWSSSLIDLAFTN